MDRHHASAPFPSLRWNASTCALILCALPIGACSGGGSDPASTALPQVHSGPVVPGEELPRPGGGTFFVDPNQSGNGAQLHLAEMFWGRLVDVHDADASGEVRAEPRFRDFVINESIVSDGVNYTLASSPVTHRTRLVIHAKKGSQLFDDLLRAAVQGMPPIVPKHDNGSSLPPFSFAARNACLVLRFDDLLKDDSDAALLEMVRARVGYPPTTPFEARMLFDPNHGGLAGSEFHSTRVLLDLTVSEFEWMPAPLALNPLGFPASQSTSPAPNVSVRIPTQIHLPSGQSRVLTNLAGNALDPFTNGPVDTFGPTRDVVRAMRSGNQEDQNNGFLLDLERPRLLGSFPLVIERARAASDQTLFLDVAFSSGCRLAPAPRDGLSAGDAFLEVLDPAVPDRSGRIRKLHVRPALPIADPAVLLGNGQLLAAFDPARAPRLQTACWLRFLPQAPTPSTGVSTTAQVSARFSEPMDPTGLESLDNFLIVRGAAVPGGSSANPTSIVVGDVLSSSALDAFTFAPLLPLAHTQGVADPYHVELTGLRDLAGNPLQHELPFADFRIDPLEATQANGSVVLRFGSSDEIGPDGLPDLRGQFFYDFSRGRLLPRPVSFTSWPVDRNNPVPSIMIPVAGGVFTPLNPLGSKLQALWRYCDVGWNVRDETKYNQDVFGLNWSPRGGLVINDFFEQFEIRLAHGRFLPDESIDNFLLPRWPASGLLGGPNLFTDNLLVDPVSPQKVVHPRSLGYAVSAADLFHTSTLTPLLPYPLNQGGGPPSTYTWRDTAVLAEAGPNNQGIPMDIEAGAPLFLEPQAGTIASAGSVPSFGLPLLIEYRCYPSDTGVGLNTFDVSLAINSSALPAFRAYSSGGINRFGVAEVVHPDTELSPRGGFNALSSPPGQRTRLSAENVFYIGQLDTVTRISRVHTVWLDTGAAAPAYLTARAAPSAAQLPSGTSVLLDFRGAVGFSPNALTAPFDSRRLDPYGDLTLGTAAFLNGSATWTSNIAAVNGARYLQARLTFVNNIATGMSAELSALGIPFLSN